MTIQEVYQKVLQNAQTLREASEEATDKELKETLSARSQELYYCASLLEKTEEINPSKEVDKAKRDVGIKLDESGYPNLKIN